MQPFTLLIKPSGSDCNLDCKYCFYKQRTAQVGHGRQRMSDEVLEKLVKDYLKLDFELSGFAWQGGEPTLMGLEFYKKVVDLQKRYGKEGQTISNSLQTNAILLDNKWCRFLHDYRFLVGISIDGPRELHDYYRLDHSGAGTFDKVMKAIEKCKKYEVEFNTLTLLNRKNAEYPDKVFDFLIENGVRYMQFIPCVELAPPTGEIADFSITPQQYGEFMCRLFDRWYDYGPQNLSIRDFDSIISYCVTGTSTICTYSKRCSGYIVIEHTGDAFCCDFFVRPEFRLGNIFETPIERLAGSSIKRQFDRAKQNLCDKCLLCRFLDVCRGGCQKDRIPFGGKNENAGIVESYLCEGYKRFFDYTMPRFMQIAASIDVANATKTPRFI